MLFTDFTGRILFFSILTFHPVFDLFCVNRQSPPFAIQVSSEYIHFAIQGIITLSCYYSAPIMITQGTLESQSFFIHFFHLFFNFLFTNPFSHSTIYKNCVMSQFYDYMGNCVFGIDSDTDPINYRGVAQVVARMTGGHEAASSSLVTPIFHF